MAKRKIKRLTAEQKRAVWAPSETNAGAGWNSRHSNDADPRNFEQGSESIDADFPLDDPERF